MRLVDAIAELWQTFLTSLYGNRVPIAVGSIIAFVAFVWIASRRGWFAAARRHPGRAAVVAAIVLAVGLPAAWYLGSPLIIRTALDEPLPLAAASLPPTAAPSEPVSPVITSPPTASASPAIAPPTSSPMRTGTFEGADEFHFGSGTARLLEASPGTWVVRFEEFSVRNGPDLHVYLSPKADGYAKAAIELGTLKATDGSFNYEVPAGTDVNAMRSVVVWCKQFAVLFAVAELH